jgi:thioredoxin 1
MEAKKITIDEENEITEERSLMVIDVSDQTFENEVVKSSLPVLLDLWAPWCGPCRMVAPIIEGLAGKYNGRVKFCRLNVDDNPKTAARYRIMSIPTLMFFKNGQVADTVIGAVPERTLQPKIDALL